MNLREYRQMYRVEDFHWWYRALHELILASVSREYRSKGALAILDAGCGTGRLCQLLQPYGSVAGFDLSDEALSCCRERGVGNLFRADLNAFAVRPGSFDMITSIDTLYHQWIIDERAILKKFREALKPGGVLILNLVAHEFLRSSHDVAVHTRHRYTRREVVILLERAGFRVEKATYRLGFLFPPIAAIRLLKRAAVASSLPEEVESDVAAPHPLLNRLLTGIARLENRLLFATDLPLGTSVFTVARKT